MTRVVGTIVILLAIIAAVGFYRGWFVADTRNSPNQSNVNVTVNKNAIDRDATHLQNQAHDTGQIIKDKLSSATSPSQNP